ncbi:MAG: DUF6125 family protein [Deltaproteobacteria bacterium]|nr:DUF6125 family protein [Deltaproteobacteria bacterium]
MDQPKTIQDLSPQAMASLVVDMFQRIIIHHGLWFAEVERQLGMEKALAVYSRAATRSYGIQMERLGKILGFEMSQGVPKPLAALSAEELKALLDGVCVNWLANDGVWFQAVEEELGMFDAKRCNDSCWVRFSPFEAQAIKNFLQLGDNSGLEGLKRALNFRLYANINKQSIIDESPNSIVFQMNDCRVQSARKRKGMEDYPCKSGGVVEYRTFASTIDSRIKTQCIACPPDEHPKEWFCAWRFTI